MPFDNTLFGLGNDGLKDRSALLYHTGFLVFMNYFYLLSYYPKVISFPFALPYTKRLMDLLWHLYLYPCLTTNNGFSVDFLSAPLQFACL